jgi:hypothetical protein
LKSFKMFGNRWIAFGFPELKAAGWALSAASGAEMPCEA